MAHFSIASALSRTFHLQLRPAAPATALRTVHRSTPRSSLQSKSARAPFSTSLTLSARKSKGPQLDRRITLIRHFLHHPTQHTPRPLRLSRQRFLRHWTITRAWRLFQLKIRSQRTLELQRQYQAMAAANEELRVGVGDGGRLFRRGMMKGGVWASTERVKQAQQMGGLQGGKGEGANGVPIEYARGLQEWVGSVGGLGRGSVAKVWDGGWKRWSRK